MYLFSEIGAILNLEPLWFINFLQIDRHIFSYSVFSFSGFKNLEFIDNEFLGFYFNLNSIKLLTQKNNLQITHIKKYNEYIIMVESINKEYIEPMLLFLTIVLLVFITESKYSTVFVQNELTNGV